MKNENVFMVCVAVVLSVMAACITVAQVFGAPSMMDCSRMCGDHRVARFTAASQMLPVKCECVETTP